MDVDSDIASRLESIAANPNQKDRTAAYLDLLSQLLSSLSSSSSTQSLIDFGAHFTTSTSTAVVVGRRVLSIYVLALCAGSGVAEKDSKPVVAAAGLEADELAEWAGKGEAAFGKGEVDEEGEDKKGEKRGEVVRGVLEKGATGWCEEQVTVLRKLHSHLLQKEEDWLGAARALMQIPLEGGSRMVTDGEKLAVYLQIVRLLLECGESGQAQTYYSRASHLDTSAADKETILSLKLCQAKLYDFSARFNEAAGRYHELSFDSSIDEEDRLHMLKAAITTSILAPSGPQRSRTLAALDKDDRLSTSSATGVPTYLSVMLHKMLLEYIVRPEEVKEFEAGLEDHQKAKVEGGASVLERAVRDHNVGACAKVYDNVSFEALGDILGMNPEGAETTARKMIEQGRLRAWIDQPLQILYFESRSAHEQDAEAQGTAGGLGVEREEKDVEPVGWMERWDERIRDVGYKVETLAAAIQAKDLLKQPTATVTAAPPTETTAA